jgi:hypothetical protein
MLLGKLEALLKRLPSVGLHMLWLPTNGSSNNCCWAMAA